jgi:hypothetical protein
VLLELEEALASVEGDDSPRAKCVLVGFQNLDAFDCEILKDDFDVFFGDIWG